MSNPTSPAPRLTALSHGAGCACQLSLDELQGILAEVSWREHEDLIVGLTSSDDAAVWRQPDGRVTVDDPHDRRRVAATNAVSDVHARGSTPRVALNPEGWPRDLEFDLLRAVLEPATARTKPIGTGGVTTAVKRSPPLTADDVTVRWLETA